MSRGSATGFAAASGCRERGTRAIWPWRLLVEPSPMHTWVQAISIYSWSPRRHRRALRARSLAILPTSVTSALRPSMCAREVPQAYRGYNSGFLSDDIETALIVAATPSLFHNRNRRSGLVARRRRQRYRPAAQPPVDNDHRWPAWRIHRNARGAEYRGRFRTVATNFRGRSISTCNSSSVRTTSSCVSCGRDRIGFSVGTSASRGPPSTCQCPDRGTGAADTQHRQRSHRSGFSTSGHGYIGCAGRSSRFTSCAWATRASRRCNRLPLVVACTEAGWRGRSKSTSQCRLEHSRSRRVSRTSPQNFPTRSKLRRSSKARTWSARHPTTSGWQKLGLGIADPTVPKRVSSLSPCRRLRMTGPQLAAAVGSARADSTAESLERVIREPGQRRRRTAVKRASAVPKCSAALG
jgi:hypothetical protein